MNTRQGEMPHSGITSAERRENMENRMGCGGMQGQDPEKREQQGDTESQGRREFKQRLVDSTKSLKRLRNETRPLHLGTEELFLTLNLNGLVSKGED